MTLKSETMRTVSCVMCSARCQAMSRCSQDIDGDQEVAVTGASGREAHKID